MTRPASARRLAALAAVALLALPAGSRAQEPSRDSTPIDLACDLFDRLADERWDAAVDLYDPATLGRWRDAVLVRHGGPREVPTVEAYRRHHPDAAVEVAEWEVARMRTILDRHLWLRRFVAVASPEELRSLSVEEAAARGLAAYDPRYQRDVARDDPDAALDAFREGRVLPTSRRVVGVVLEGDRAYVAYRRTEPGAEPVRVPWPPALLPLVRSMNGWVVTTRDPGVLLDENPGFALRPEEAPEIEGRPGPEASCAESAKAGEAPEEALDLARRFLGRLEAREWEAAAALFERSDLERWRDLQIRLRHRSRDPSAIPTVEKLERVLGLPRAVAEWRVETMRVPMEWPWALDFEGVESLEAFRALTPRQAAARRLERLVRRSEGPPGAPVASRPVEVRREPLGGVVEGSRAHVLFVARRSAETADGRSIELVDVRPAILTLESTPAGWAVASETLDHFDR